jgi:hypothetical protein
LSGSWRQEYIDLNGGVGSDPIGSRLANRCETWHDESPSQKRASEAENYLPADRATLMHLHSARAAAARCRLQQRVQYLGAFAVSSGWPAVDVRACRRKARIAPSSCCSNRDFTTRVGCFADAKLTRRAVMCYPAGDASTRRSVSSPPQQKEAERIEQKGLLEVACEVAVTQYLVVERDVLISSTEEFDPCAGCGGGAGKSCTTPRRSRRHARGRVG